MEQLSEFVINHWLLVTAFCAVLGLLIANLLSGASGVSAQQAVTIINRAEAVVVDVRSAGEFAKAHIIGAINIPQGELEQAPARLRRYQGKPLLVYCASGSTSAAAVRKLRQLGVAEVQSISGGLVAWRQENLPVTADLST
jgi:rhodanese-related sulfurtransferase